MPQTTAELTAANMGARLRVAAQAGRPLPWRRGALLPDDATPGEIAALDALGPEDFHHWAGWGHDSGRPPLPQ